MEEFVEVFCRQDRIKTNHVAEVVVVSSVRETATGENSNILLATRKLICCVPKKEKNNIGNAAQAGETIKVVPQEPVEPLNVSVWLEFVGSGSIADTYDDDGLGDNCGEEGAHGADETYSCVWNDSILPKIHNPVMRPSEFSLAIVFPASTVTMATVSLIRKKAVQLVPRAVRPRVHPRLEQKDRLARSPKLDCWRDLLRGCTPWPGLASGDNFRVLHVFGRATA